MNGMKRNKWGWYDIDFIKMNQKVLDTQKKNCSGIRRQRLQ
jgi:hypothetical protein